MSGRPAWLLSALTIGGAVLFAAVPAQPSLLATAATKAAPTRGSACSGAFTSESDPISRAGGSRSCQPVVHPETPDELMLAHDEISARLGNVTNAQFEAALRQRDAIAAATASANAALSGAWKSVGKGPEQNRCDIPVHYNQAPTGDLCTLGYPRLSGRPTALAYDPQNASRIFASESGGGVFESTNGGKNWFSVGDGLPTQTTGGMAFTTANGGTLVVGSGDGAFGGYVYEGHGIYYSTDDGHAWHRATMLPRDVDNFVTFKVAVDPSNPLKVYVGTNKGLFRSTDGGQSFTDVNLPTTPAGYPYNCAGNYTKASPDFRCFFATNVTDVVIRPAGGTVPGGLSNKLATDAGGEVIAAVGYIGGQAPLHGTTVVAAPQNGLYISNHPADQGAPNTFKWVNSGTNPLTNNGFAIVTHVGRTSLSIADGSGQDHNIVYALVQDATKIQGCLSVLGVDSNPGCKSTLAAAGGTFLDGAYKSADFGQTWTKVMDWTQLKNDPTTGSALGNTTGIPPGSYAPGVQSWYNNWIQVDPTAVDANKAPTRVLFGLEEVWENDASKPVLPLSVVPIPTMSWKVIGRYWNACSGLIAGPTCSIPPNVSPGTTTHPDQHAHMLIPIDGGVRLYIGSDGGVWTQVADQAHKDFDNASWGSGVNNGLQTFQGYDVDVSDNGTVLSGLQDNGQLMILPDGSQNMIYGGDAFFNGIDPANPKNMIEEYAYGLAAATDDGGATWCTIDPGFGSANAAFATPLQRDPRNAKHYVTVGNAVMEQSLGYSFKPCDPTNTQTTQSPWTASYTPAAAPDTKPFIGSATDILGSTIYAAFCEPCRLTVAPFDNLIATNAGGTWKTVAATGLPKRYINAIRMDPLNPKTVFVALATTYLTPWITPGAEGDPTGLLGSGVVFKSTDGGETFTNITHNLPKTSVTSMAIRNGQPVVGTQMGAFMASDSSGTSWSTLGTGMPNTPILGLRFQQNSGCNLYAATFGRGVYKYTFPGSCGVVPGTEPPPVTPAVSPAASPAPVVTHNPNTSAGAPGLPLLLIGLVVLLAGLAPRRRRA